MFSFRQIFIRALLFIRSSARSNVRANVSLLMIDTPQLNEINTSPAQFPMGLLPHCGLHLLTYVLALMVSKPLKTIAMPY
jgi:hypothetical protein